MTDTPLDPSTLYGHVVVGYDGSTSAVRALTHAADEADRRNTMLQVVCGHPWHITRSVLDAAVDRVRRRHPGLRVVTSVSGEAAAAALVNAGRTAALTVVGSRGRGGFAGLLLGSVSLRVAAHSHSPLMVVRDDRNGGADGGASSGTVLVAVRDDEDGEAVAYAFDEAHRRGAGLFALHAWQFPPPPAGQLPPVAAARRRQDTEALRKAAAAVPRYAVSRLSDKYPEVRANTDHVCRDTAAALVRASRDAEVLVLAAHRNPHHLGLQLGPVTHAVLHHAHCPVVLVPVG